VLLELGQMNFALQQVQGELILDAGTMIRLSAPGY
jgi:hypothetical protein